MSKPGWRYGLAFTGILVGLVGAIYLTFEGIKAVEPDAFEASATPVPVPPPVPVAAPPAPDSANHVPLLPAPAPLPVPAQPPVPPDPRLAVRDTAYRLSQAGRDADARTVLERWLADNPDDRAIRLEVARFAARQGDRPRAWDHYRRLLSLGDDDSTRAEYAAALLAAGEHGEAATEFDRLLARDGDRTEWQLGAARARLWGGKPGQALALLGTATTPPDSDRAALRRQARMALELAVPDATAWVAEDPADPNARLALARALARADSPRQALVHYYQAAAARPSAALWTEVAGVASVASDSAAVAAALGQAVAIQPDDRALRRRYAEALVWAGDWNAAIGELDRVVGTDPSAGLFQRRGDLLRWRGERARARDDYRRALALDPTSGPARQALAALRRDVLRDVRWADDEGTAVTTSGRGDSEGFGSLIVRAAHGAPLDLDRRTVVSGAVEYRWATRDATGPGADPAVSGSGGDFGIGHRFERVRLAARFGALWFGNADRIVTWRLGAEGTRGALGWRAGVGRAPAYEALRTGGTLGSALGGTGPPLAGTAGDVTVTHTFRGGIELWSRAELIGLGDANERTTFETALRFAVAPDLSLVYSGGLLGFGDRASAYWSPALFTLHSLGLEYRRSWLNGWLFSVQALPGMAWSRRAFPTSGPDLTGTFQWQVGGEAAYRRQQWDLGLQAGFGRDRGGLYSSSFGTMRVRYRW